MKKPLLIARRRLLTPGPSLLWKEGSVRRKKSLKTPSFRLAEERGIESR